MSYLGALRLHFAGRFQAAVSTVNNDPAHYNNADFVPSDWELNGPNMNPPNGWWNPHGDADWRVIGCGVTSAWLGDGAAAAADDPVLGMFVADSDQAAPAKLVDLDPCQQLVSTIWGLELRIADAHGNTLVGGAFEPIGFMDIWDRAAAGGGDINACAYYQSVLTGVRWGDVSGSPFLTELQAASPDGVLSVKFMVDGYNMTFGAPEFTRGRIVGTIGPGSPSEPAHMVLGRQFTAAERVNPPPNFFFPAGKINFCQAVVDTSAAKVYLDLGNALPTVSPGGAVMKIGDLSLRVGSDTICPIPYASAGWYEQTAGIVALPADRPLTAQELTQIAASPLSLWVDGATKPAISEAPVYVRADQFVFRSDPGKSVTVNFHASRLGEPLVGEAVLLTADASQLQPSPPDYPVATPDDGVGFPASVQTGADGVAVVTVTTKSPGTPRGMVDGQVYGIQPALADDPGSPADPWNFVSILVFGGFEPDDPVTWLGSLEPIFTQYHNLYPIMMDFLDLSSYADVCEHRELLLLAFGLGTEDSNSMPVTRDLSTAKRTAILSWLENLGPDGNPLLGSAPPAAAPAEGRNEIAAPTDLLAQGGKSAAAARRLIHTQGTT